MSDRRIVALSIDKVQTFLTEVIHAQTQEKQAEEATLQNIMNASMEISIGFYQTVQEVFPKSETEELLSCSGVYIFECGLSAEEIGDRLNKLFLHFYYNSQGQKMLRCVSFPYGNLTEIEVILEAKNRLKQSDSLNEWIERNREILFSFCTVKEEKSRFEKTEYPLFAENINALYSAEESDNPKRFRIAVIKADLDGMGDMFKNIKSYDDYSRVSRILNEEVSLNGLHKGVKECDSTRSGWVFPFYMAGDDIFFAVTAANLMNGIQICRNILKNINDRLEKVIPEKRLTMSVGAEITFNREPVRYYMDMVERQLKNAKKAWSGSLKKFMRMKISIYGMTYLDIDYPGLKIYKKQLACTHKGYRFNCPNCKKRRAIKSDLQSIPIWNFFLTDVNRLNYLRAEENGYHKLLGTSGFYYTLLERLTDETVQENDIEYMNSVLYHLLPQFSDASDKDLQRWELLLNGGIVQQLLQLKGRGAEIVVNTDTKQRLETYLRLMLLFSDSRFQIAGNSELKEKATFQKSELENAHKYLTSKPLDYLYNTALKGNNRLREIFVDKVSYEIEKEEKWEKRQCLQRLKIEKSMFIKLRDTGKISVEKVAKMIELHNPSDLETKIKIQEQNKQRMEKGKAPCYRYFDKEKFCRAANQTGLWNEDFVDSLMLLYEYKEIEIQYKTNKLF